MNINIVYVCPSDKSACARLYPGHQIVICCACILCFPLAFYFLRVILPRIGVAQRFTYLNEYITHAATPQKCLIPRNLAWRQRQIGGFSGSWVTGWVVMVMFLGGVPRSCGRIFFTQYRRETVRHKSALNCRVTRGWRGRRREREKARAWKGLCVCHGEISCHAE